VPKGRKPVVAAAVLDAVEELLGRE
jgi:hypothetical protein